MDTLDPADLLDLADFLGVAATPQFLLRESDELVGVDTDALALRSDSKLSQTSTLAADELRIQAFCTFNGWIVTIAYPSESVGWIYRADMGGHSQHRWEYADALILTARHSTCIRAMIPKPTCRNCIMKTVWRRECIDPCNTFYIQPMSNVAICVDALQPLVIAAVQATAVEATQYMKHAPKLSSMRKRVAADSDDKIIRMLRLERNLRMSLMGATSPTTMVSANSLNTDLYDMLDEVMDIPPKPDVLVSSSNTAIVVPTVRNLPPPNVVRASTLIGSPTRHGTVVDSYNSLIERFVDYDCDKKVMFTREQIQSSFSNHARLFMPNAMLATSIPLDHLFLTMGIAGNSQLLVKSCLAAWMRRLSETDGDPVAVYIGFYVAPTLNIYRELYMSALLPTFVTQSSHRMEHDYDCARARAKAEVSPVLAAYFSPTVASMVSGMNLLPLGVISRSM